MRRVAVVCLVACFASVALADVVKKKDGIVLEGEITDEDEDAVTLKMGRTWARIPRSEIESIERKPVKSIESDLEKIKIETSEKLEALAKEAEKAKKHDVARALRDAIQEAKAWSVYPKAQRKDEKGAKPEDSKPKAGDFVALCKKCMSWSQDNKDLTEIQRQKAWQAFTAEHTGKLLRATVKVDEVRKNPNGDGLEVKASCATYDLTLYFTEEEDLAKLEKAKKGSTLVVEGKAAWTGGWLPALNEVRIK